MARRTKAEADATRELLLDAAEEAFLENGVSGTSLEAIARRAGHTRGAIYWHFRNKEELFAALLERVRLPLGDLVAEFSRDTDGDPLATLRQLCRFGLRRLVADPRHRRVHTILIYRCERLGDTDPSVHKQEEIIDEFLRLAEHQFAAAAARDALNPALTPRAAASALLAYLWGLVSQNLRDPAECDLERNGEAMLEAFFGGVTRPVAGDSRDT